MDTSPEIPASEKEMLAKAENKPETPPRSTANKPLTSRRTLLRGLMGAAGLALLKSDSRTPSPVDRSEHAQTHEMATERLPYDPTPEEIAAVEAIFDQPGRPSLDLDNIPSAEESAREYTRLSVEAAGRHGLTVYDFRTFAHNLATDAHKEGGPAYDFATYFQKAQAFFKLYDIALLLGDEQQTQGSQYDVLDQATLEQATVKKTLVGFIEELGKRPVEVMKETGMKKVILVKGDNVDERGHADIDTGDTFYVDPTYVDGTAVIHDAYHIYDVNHADTVSMRQDRGFRALNPQGEKIYKKDIEDFKPPSSGQYISDEEYNNFRSSYGNPEAQAANVIAATDYGLNNAVEDKAEIATRFLDPFRIADMLDRKKPILRRKAIFLLARLYHDNPAFVKFYADVSRRE